MSEYNYNFLKFPQQNTTAAQQNTAVAQQKMQMQKLQMAFFAKALGMDPKELGTIFQQASDTPTQPDISKIETRTQIMNENSSYIDKVDGGIKDVTSATGSSLNGDQQNYAAQNGLFNAPKESLSVMVDDKDRSSDLKDYIQDNKVDFNAMEKRKSEIEKDKSYAGLNATNMTGVATQNTALTDNNAATFGLTVENGKMNASQVDTLKRQGIIDEKNNFTADAIKKLEEQKKSNEEATLLGKVTTADEKDPAKQQAKIYAQTGEKTAQRVETDKDGNIQGLSSTPEARTTEKQAILAKKQLTTGNADSDKILAKKGVTTVDKNGNTTINTDGLNADEIAKVNKLSYNGTGKLTIKNKNNNALELELGKNTTQVDLQGGSFKVSTENKALQIKADTKTALEGIKGQDLEHLVIQGGNVKTDLSADIGKLKALKIENANLLNGLNANSNSDIAVELNDVKSETDKAISIASQKDAQIKSNGSSLKNVNVEAKGTAVFEGDNNTKAGDIKLSGQKTIASANGMQANSIDVSRAQKDSGVFLAKGTKIQNGITTNATLAKDKNEIVYEDKEDKNLTNIKIKGKDGKETDNITSKEMETKDVFKYLGWSESKFKKIQAEEKYRQENPNAAQYDIAQNDSGLQRFFKGFAMGVGSYNQQQQQNLMLQQYPWMQGNQFKYFG